jgi:creatinine amidohydrolase/Fe(II)-dependent formamide hydrolase-like protein
VTALRQSQAAVLVAVWLAVTCIVTGVSPASAASTPESVFLEDFTWTELRAAIDAGTTTIIVPIGGTEQNGPHMALGKHNVRARVLAERIARGLGNAVVAPVIAYVPEGGLQPATGHMRFAGTITVPEEAFQRVLQSAVQSFRVHGFRDIVLIGDHGSTQASQKAVAARLNRDWHAGPARVHAIDEYYRAATSGFRDVLKARGYRADELGEHAALADTSLTLAVDPRLVRATVLGADRAPGSESGVDGDPRRAGADLGQLGVDLIVGRTIAAIKNSITRR